MREGHDYNTILHTYTLAHLRIFLQEIDSRHRRQRIDNIYNLRTAQLELKHFKEQVRKLEEHDRQIRRAQARAEGRRLQLDMSEREAEAFDSQRHEYLSDWTDAERERFKTEQSSLWNLIPEQFRAKAERLARGGLN